MRKRKKTNPFKAAKAPAPETSPETSPVPEPDPGGMSDEQLDAELARAKEDLRRLKISELASTREAAEAAKPKSSTERNQSRFLLPTKKRRPYWK